VWAFFSPKIHITKVDYTNCQTVFIYAERILEYAAGSKDRQRIILPQTGGS
jgi:hypothetical protein